MFFIKLFDVVTLVLWMGMVMFEFSYGSDVLCDFDSVPKLMEITNSTSCSSFKKNYLVPFDPHYGSSYWESKAIKDLQHRLFFKIQKKQIVRIGVLGGSVSLSWPNSTTPMASILQSLFDYPNIEVYNGAMGGTGAIVNAGCLSTILSDLVLDVIILEFAINEFVEKSLQLLVDHLKQRFNDNITIIMLTVTSRRMKTENPVGLAKCISMNKAIAKQYGLILIDWSSVVDKGYGITYKPDQIWNDNNKQHPMVIGNDWIQYCVAASMKAIYDHHRDPSTTEAIMLQPPINVVKKQDTLCLSSFMCDVFGVHMHRFEQYAHTGKCWKMAVKDKFKTCTKLAFENNVGSECKQDSDNMLSVTVQVDEPCSLYFTVVGDGAGKPMLTCSLGVFIDDKFIWNVTGRSQYLSQSPYVLLPHALDIGMYNLSLIGKGTMMSPPCSLGSIICV